MNLISRLLCLIILMTFVGQAYSAETFTLMDDYGTNDAYQAEQSLKAQQEILTKKNIARGVKEYKKGITKILKRSDKRIGRLFLKKKNLAALKHAKLNTTDKVALGKQIRVLLQKELKRDIASQVDIQSSFVKDFEHTLVRKSKSGFGRFMCHVGRITIGIIGVALIAAAFVAGLMAGFVQSAGLLFAGLGIAAAGFGGGLWLANKGFMVINCD